MEDGGFLFISMLYPSTNHHILKQRHVETQIKVCLSGPLPKRLDLIAPWEHNFYFLLLVLCHSIPLLSVSAWLGLKRKGKDQKDTAE